MTNSIQEAQEILDGVMLGDGSLVRHKYNAYFSIGLSKVLKDGRVTMKDNFTWLQYIKNQCLIPLGIEVSGIYPQYKQRKYTVGQHKGELFTFVTLVSYQSPYLTKEYDRWYSWTGEWNGKYRKGDTKVLSENLTLTPKILANWFKGDGECCRNTNQYNTVQTGFSTNGYTEEEVYHLMGMLYDMGIITRKPGYNGGNPIRGADLRILIAQRSVNHLFNLISPYMSSHRGMMQYKYPENITSSIATEFEAIRHKLYEGKYGVVEQ